MNKASPDSLKIRIQNKHAFSCFSLNKNGFGSHVSNPDVAIFHTTSQELSEMPEMVLSSYTIYLK